MTTQESPEPRRVAVFLPNWVGDAVMATPAVRSLRTRFPAAEFLGVLRPPVDDVLAGTGLLDDVLRWVPRGGKANTGTRAVTRALRERRADLAVLFPNSLRTAWAAWRAGVPRRVGFARDGRGLLLTDRLTPADRGTPNPVVLEYLRLAAHLGGDADRRDTELATDPLDDNRFAAWRRELLPGGRGLVALNPGGAFGAAKHWPAGHFAELARRVVAEHRRDVVVLCGPAERDTAKEIADRAEHPRVAALAGERLSIGLSKSAVRAADALVTTDSGPRHFARPFGVPTVGLFGPTHVAWSETFDPRAVHLQEKLPCGPCQKRVCPLGHLRCMTDLSPARVSAELGRLLTEAPIRVAA